MALSARQWKDFYAKERETLGERGLERLVAEAPDVEVPNGGALVFPHTRLAASGALVAAAARAVVRSGADEVLAIGVLHHAREEDADLVARARSGDAAAVRALRRVHGPGADGDQGHWLEEFSLDAFSVLVDTAARNERRSPPRIVRRYPYLVGPNPGDLPGLGELASMRARGCPVVATADPIHHGAGYETPAAAQRPREDPQTVAFARACVEEGFALLARRDWSAFLAHAAEHRSDFRDAGPAMASVLEGPLAARVKELALVDYADVLGAPQPTWVAASLSAFVPLA